MSTSTTHRPATPVTAALALLALAASCGGPNGETSRPRTIAPRDGATGPTAEPPWAGCPEPAPAPEVSRTELRAFLDRGLPDLLGRVRTAPVLDRQGPGARFLGFRIVSMDPALRCGRFGVREGDVLTAVNGRGIERPEEALEVFQSLDEATSITLSLVRGTSAVEATVTVLDDAVRITNDGVSVGGP